MSYTRTAPNFCGEVSWENVNKGVSWVNALPLVWTRMQYIFLAPQTALI